MYATMLLKDQKYALKTQKYALKTQKYALKNFKTPTYIKQQICIKCDASFRFIYMQNISSRVGGVTKWCYH